MAEKGYPDDEHDGEGILEDMCEVLKQLEENRDEMEDNMDALRLKLAKINYLHEEGLNKKLSASETSALLDYDSEAVSTVASMFLNKVRKSDESKGFDIMEFAEKMSEQINPDGGEVTKEKLVAFGQTVLSMFRTFPNVQWLNGCLPRGEVVAGARERKRRLVDREVGALTQPDNVTASSNLDPEEETTRLVDNVYKCLKSCVRNNNKQPVPFWAFVLDPTSYSRTIENIFHMQFLVRDSLVAIEGGRDATVRPLPRSSRGDQENSEEDQERRHFVLEMDHDKWQRLIEETGRSEPMIKQFVDNQAAGSSGVLVPRR